MSALPPPATHGSLKPCPLCGSRAEVVHASHIRCVNTYNCDCETRLGPTAWNRRAPVSETAPLVAGDLKTQREIHDSYAPSAIAPFEGVRLYEEHGWITIRSETGWLLWSSKGSRIPNTGFDLDGILAEVKKNVEKTGG